MISLEGLTPNRRQVRVLDFETEYDGKICITVSNPQRSSGWSIIVDLQELVKIFDKLKT